MASGMDSSHRGFAGTVEVLSAGWPPCRLAPWTGFAQVTSAWTSTCGLTRRRPPSAGCASGSTARRATMVPGRLEPSVSYAGGAAEATSTATSPATRVGRPQGAAAGSPLEACSQQVRAPRAVGADL